MVIAILPFVPCSLPSGQRALSRTGRQLAGTILNNRR